jgi:hypothetical protein
MAKMRFGKHVLPHERYAVAWYQLDVLGTAARDVVSSLDQLRNTDLRESFPQPMSIVDCSQAEHGSFWFDFIADTGDGGNATYAVAHTALGAEVVQGDTRLPRGQLLVFGGDLAYPSASPDQYRYRFIEMFEGARRDTGEATVQGKPLTVVALAQNHDWMDSASTFSRYFLRSKLPSQQFLGASIPQRHTYFCVKLPNGWWMIGLDFALAGDIDRDQYEQFERLVTEGQIKPSDGVIMVYPEPYWTRPIGDGAEPCWPWRYQRLEGLLGSRIRLRLAGDLHHYMRWQSEKHGMLITCGTGGAFSHPTHTFTTTRPISLQEQANEDAVPAEPSKAIVIGHDDNGTSDDHFDRVEKSCYPTPEESRQMAWDNVWALLKVDPTGRSGNWSFAAMLAGLYWFNAYLNSVPFNKAFHLDGFDPMWMFRATDYGKVLGLWLKAMIFSPFGFVMNLAMVGGCILIGREAVNELSPRKSRLFRWFATWGLGFLHALVHAFAVFNLEFWLQQAIGTLPYIGIPYDSLGAILHALAVGSLLALGGGVGGALIFGTYLALMSHLGLLTNNGFSALGIEDFKGFLRFRISPEGLLEGHFVAIEKVPRSWKLSRTSRPMWEPADGKPIDVQVADTFVLAKSETAPHPPV